MNGKVAKMLRRLKKDTKAGKKEFKEFNTHDREIVRLDYTVRGMEVRQAYSKMKRDKKREQISNS